MHLLLDAEAAERGLQRVADEILKRPGPSEDLVVIGIRRGGIAVAEHLLTLFSERGRKDVPFGTVDITLYRDDAATALPNPRIGPSKIPVGLEGVRVILVDDVLYTGRTVRAAIDALMDYGRPRAIELMVLVDREGRELPIQADYSVTRVALDPSLQVAVQAAPDGLRAVAQPFGTPSTLPGDS